MPKAKAVTWQNRIVRTGTRRAADFNFNPENWRGHPQSQRDALNAILSEVGWVQGVIVNVRTNRLIDGHARVEEALALGADTPVPFTEVDLSPEEEKLILLLLDPLGGMATTNAEAFQNLAQSLDIESAALLDAISGLSEDHASGLEGLEPNLNDPNFNYQNQFGVIVECESEAHQKRVFDELQAAGHKVKVVVV